MGFWKNVADTLHTDEVLRGLDRGQSEALIDTLTLVLYADDEATFLELNELEHLLHELPWALQDHAEVDAYAEQSAEVASALSSREGFRQRAADIAARLGDDAAREKALFMAAALIFADWDASPEEQQVLAELAEAFGISEARTQEILEREGDASTTLTLSSHAAPAPASVETPEEDPLDRVLGGRPKNVQAALSQDFLQGFFDGLFADEVSRTLTREQSLGFVEALTLALVADGFPEHAEREQFKVYLKGLPFTTIEAPAVIERFEATIDRLSASRQDPELLSALITDIAGALQDPTLRLKALRMAVIITHADLLITGEEENVLFSIAEGFEIPIERLEELIVEVKTAAEGA